MLKRSDINGPVMVSLIVIAIALVIVGLRAPSLVSAVFSGSRGDDEPARVLANMVTQHEEVMETYKARFDGRKVFTTLRPTPKPRPPQPPRTRRTPDPVDDAPPIEIELAPPAIYQGPSMFAVFGDEVGFMPLRPGDDPLWVRRGEEKSGIEVIDIFPPSGARVRYAGGEYDVPLFDWDTNGPFRAPPPSRQPVPGLLDVPRTPPASATATAPETTAAEAERAPTTVIQDKKTAGSESKQDESREDVPPSTPEQPKADSPPDE